MERNQAGQVLDPPQNEMVTFDSGARRAELKPRYDLIPACALRRLAERYALGASKYGEYNWQKGLPVGDTLNHIIDHLLVYREKLDAAKH